MATSILMSETKFQKIGKTPVVVVPLKLWQSIEEQLEELEMTRSPAFRKKIAKARSEKKLYSISELKKTLSL